MESFSIPMEWIFVSIFFKLMNIIRMMKMKLIVEYKEKINESN